MRCICGEEVKVSVGGDSCDGGKDTVTGLNLEQQICKKPASGSNILLT